MQGQPCPKCETPLYGLVTTCYKCGYAVDFKGKLEAERAAKAEAREARRRRSIFYRLWFALRIRPLAGPCRAGRLALYAADHNGSGRFAAGNRLMNDHKLWTREIARGPAVWAPIEADAPGLRVALTCAKCGFVHLIRAGDIASPGLRLTGMAIGHFGGYDGAWRGPWFELFAPALVRTGSPHWANVLNCQSCGETTRPRIRRY